MFTDSSQQIGNTLPVAKFLHVKMCCAKAIAMANADPTIKN